MVRRVVDVEGLLDGDGDEEDGSMISVSDLFCVMVLVVEDVMMSIAYDGFTRPGLGG